MKCLEKYHSTIAPIIIFILASMVLIAMTGCNDGPSKSGLDSALRKSLSDGVPATLGGPRSLESGIKITIKELKILKVGAVLDKEKLKVWPVRISVQGTYTSDYTPTDTPFGGEIEYLAAKNSFDEWVTAPSLVELFAKVAPPIL